MRVVASVCTALTLAACQAPQAPQVDLAAETAAVTARSKAVAAEAAMDTEKSLTFWAPDAIVQPAGQPQIQGTEGIRALYKHFFESGMLKSFQGTATKVEVAASGDLAWEYGVNKFVLKGPTGDLLDTGKYLIVWKKINGEWMVAGISFTSDAAAPVPATP